MKKICIFRYQDKQKFYRLWFFCHLLITFLVSSFFSLCIEKTFLSLIKLGIIHFSRFCLILSLKSKRKKQKITFLAIIKASSSRKLQQFWTKMHKNLETLLRSSGNPQLLSDFSIFRNTLAILGLINIIIGKRKYKQESSFIY